MILLLTCHIGRWTQILSFSPAMPAALRPPPSPASAADIARACSLFDARAKCFPLKLVASPRHGRPVSFVSLYRRRDISMSRFSRQQPHADDTIFAYHFRWATIAKNYFCRYYFSVMTPCHDNACRCRLSAQPRRRYIYYFQAAEKPPPAFRQFLLVTLAFHLHDLLPQFRFLVAATYFSRDDFRARHDIDTGRQAMILADEMMRQALSRHAGLYFISFGHKIPARQCEVSTRC